MTQDEVLQFLREGGRIRWLPKSIVYNEVRGPDCRFLFVGPRRITDRDEDYVLQGTLEHMERQGLLKRMEGRDGVLRIVLPEDYVPPRKKPRRKR